MVGLWLGSQLTLNAGTHSLVKGNGLSRQLVDGLRLGGFHWVVILLRILLVGKLQTAYQFLQPVAPDRKTQTNTMLLQELGFGLFGYFPAAVLVVYRICL